MPTTIFGQCSLDAQVASQVNSSRLTSYSSITEFCCSIICKKFNLIRACSKISELHSTVFSFPSQRLVELAGLHSHRKLATAQRVPPPGELATAVCQILLLYFVWWSG